jgi:rubredoxin
LILDYVTMHPSLFRNRDTHPVELSAKEIKEISLMADGSMQIGYEGGTNFREEPLDLDDLCPDCLVPHNRMTMADVTPDKDAPELPECTIRKGFGA